MGGDDEGCIEGVMSAAKMGVVAGAMYGAVRSAWTVMPQEVGAGAGTPPSLGAGSTMRTVTSARSTVPSAAPAKRNQVWRSGGASLRRRGGVGD